MIYQNKDFTPLLSEKVWPSLETKLLAGIKDQTVRDNLKTVLANTRSALLSDTRMQNNVYLPKLVLPLVRRIFPKLIANNIISTQPMTGPSGWIRFLDAYVDKLDNTSENIYPWQSDDSQYSTAQTAVTVDLDIAVATPTVSGVLSVPAWAEGTMYVELGDKASTSDVFTRIASIDKNGVIVTLPNSPAKVIGAVDPQTGQYTINFVTVPLVGGVAREVRLSYAQDFQKNIPFGDDQTYPKMRFGISKISIEAKSRKLGASYSLETMEDYQAEFNESFEDRMVDYLTTTILTELDSEIINGLVGKASHLGSWSAEMPSTWTRGQNAWYETVMPKINKLSNTIFQTTHVAGASFAVCSPITATVIQGMQQYEGAGKAQDVNMSVGTVKSGTLSGMYNVFVSPLCPDGKVLLGFKGNTPEETGAVYAPYVPVSLVPITYNEGQPSILARTRYAFNILRPDYYGVLTVSGI